jgi:hypothetical protein
MKLFEVLDRRNWLYEYIKTDGQKYELRVYSQV